MVDEENFAELLDLFWDEPEFQEKILADEAVKISDSDPTQMLRNEEHKEILNKKKRLGIIRQVSNKKTREELLRREDKKRPVKKSKKVDSSHTITINDFVRDYLYPGLDFNATGFIHDNLASFDTVYIIKVSNDFGQNHISYVLNNYLLVVIDAKGNPVTYVNPILLRRFVEGTIAGEKNPVPGLWDLIIQCKCDRKVVRIINKAQVATAQEEAVSNNHLVKIIGGVQ